MFVVGGVALGGLLLSLFPAILVAVGLAGTEGADRGLWQGIAVIITPFILMGAVSAAVTLKLARAGERRELAGAGAKAPGAET